jgi:hypothetical protein
MISDGRQAAPRTKRHDPSACIQWKFGRVARSKNVRVCANNRRDDELMGHDAGYFGEVNACGWVVRRRIVGARRTDCHDLGRVELVDGRATDGE